MSFKEDDTKKINRNHGGPGRGQGRHCLGDEPRERIGPWVAQSTLKALERECKKRKLDHIGQVLDQDYQLKKAKPAAQQEDALEKKH